RVRAYTDVLAACPARVGGQGPCSQVANQPLNAASRIPNPESPIPNPESPIPNPQSQPLRHPAPAPSAPAPANPDAAAA
ncbi:hypothetical protein XarbCFBP8138_00005, partial [Xanthomonas arboricola]